MKLTRKISWLLLVLAVPFLLWGERELRILMLTRGTWQVRAEENYRRCLRFHRDGTGEQITDWQGKRRTERFTYKFSGLSHLQAISIDSKNPRPHKSKNGAFYGTQIVDSYDDHIVIVTSDTLFLSFGLDGNIYVTNPNAEEPFYKWQRVALEPLPDESR